MWPAGSPTWSPGTADLRFVGLLTVTADTETDLEAACVATEAAAAQGMCEIRRLAGQQAPAFLAGALPLARVGRMSTRTRSPPGRGFDPVGRLRLPAHRESSATLAGAYPFLAAPAPNTGVPIGTDTLTGSVFAFDPWTLYAAGVLTNPNMLLAGVIGQGKSALAKSLAIRSIAAGRRVYVPGDPKGEWAAVAHAVGGRVLTLGPGQHDRLNPLDTPPGSDPREPAQASWRLLGTLAETALDRALAPVEHTLLGTALTATTATGGVPTMRGLVDHLADPDPRGRGNCAGRSGSTRHSPGT